MNEPVQSVDLTNCDREPIHILGAVQPIGFLIALTSDWMVARASANVETWLGKGPEEILGKALSEVFSAGAVHDLRNRTIMLRGPDSVERLFGVEVVAGRPPLDLALHLSGGSVVIEGEPSSGEQQDSTSLVRSMIGRLDQCTDLNTFFREGARQVRGLTGFDRVMVYRFAPDGSGEVVGEACKPGIGTFFGLRYPASDIPQQARELYRRNLLRVIADVDAEPVPIVPQLDPSGRPLDLSLSVLRAVSPIHIEYLRNMGVGASMSISIIVEDRLWGLFACHHYSPRCPSFERRSVCELFSQMFSMRLEARERREHVAYERRARDISDQL
ncbi:GAF domain-containing protein, partial [Reyranella sp.]|uniref:GAF domain-containing protein n=1 Tax=Reyranella sp. TaxID=1929291 RepID=UPI003F702533